MFWIVVVLVVGIAIGIVLGDMLNVDSFKNLFISNGNNQNS